MYCEDLHEATQVCLTERDIHLGSLQASEMFASQIHVKHMHQKLD